MKTIALIAATGSLAAMTAPAMAADFSTTASGTLAGTPAAFVDYSAPFADQTALNYGHGRYYDDDRRYKRGRGRGHHRHGDYDDRVYDRDGRYLEPRRVSRNDRVWRGRDGQYYCQRDNGTTGLIIGAAGGALLGRTIDTRGDRTVGTLLGGALGAVLGREIDRGGARCR